MAAKWLIFPNPRCSMDEWLEDVVYSGHDTLTSFVILYASLIGLTLFSVKNVCTMHAGMLCLNCTYIFFDGMVSLKILYQAERHWAFA